MQPKASAWGICSAFKNVNRVRWHDHPTAFMDRNASVTIYLICHGALQAEDEFDVRMFVRVHVHCPGRHPFCYARKPSKTNVFGIDLVADMHVSIVFHGAYYTLPYGEIVRRTIFMQECGIIRHVNCKEKELRHLHGVVPPMVTPLTQDRRLDAEGLERLVAHILGGGVHGLFALGTTGEAPDLSYDVRRELVERTCALVSGRVPVLVGITDTILDEAVKMAFFARDCGASALVAAPPYYFAAGQPELLAYYRKLADALPLPLFLYNMPSQVKVMIEVKTVVELSHHPKIVGLKDSSGNIGYFNACLYALRDRPDFSVLMGPEEAMGEAVLMGASGGVAGGANIFPRLFVDLYDAATAMDVPRVRALQERVMRSSSLLYGVGHHNSSFVKGVKCALSLMGICSDTLAEPREPFNTEDREKIRSSLVTLGALAQ